MILILDNYDSFTYNIVQYLGKFTSDIQVFRNDQITIQKIENLNPQGIIISPGPKAPKDAGISKELISNFMGKTPILGICLGHQAIGEVMGGSIICCREIFHGKPSDIHHNGQEIFKNIPNPMQATRYHSLMIDPKSIPSNIEVIAKTNDDVIMAIKVKDVANVWGVQFHPESILTTDGILLIQNFYEFCKK